MLASHSPMIQLARRGRRSHYDPKGPVVHIKDVLSGKRCDCFCIECEAQLVARKGDIKEWSFAHLPQSASSYGGGHGCSASGESLLHRLAKEVLAEDKKMLLKAVFVLSRLQRNFHGKSKFREKKGFINFAKSFETFERVELEQAHRLDDGSIIRPDATVYQDGKVFCCVEFFVTHRVDDEKTRKIEKLGYPCLEIDISDGVPVVMKDEKGQTVLRNGWDVRELREAFITGDPGQVKSRQKWIFHPGKKELFFKTLQENRELFDQELQQMERDALREEDNRRKREAVYLSGSDRPMMQAFFARQSEQRRQVEASSPDWTLKVVRNIYQKRGTMTLNMFPGTLQFSSDAAHDEYDLLFSPNLNDDDVSRVINLWKSNGIPVKTRIYRDGIFGKMPVEHHVKACHLVVEQHRNAQSFLHTSELHKIILDFDSRYTVFQEPSTAISEPVIKNKSVFPVR